MSMRPQHIPDIPKETVQVARAAFPKGSIYMQIRDTLGSIYGLDKTHLQHILIATALNLVRLNAWLSEVPFAKTRFSRFKQLQPKPA